MGTGVHPARVGGVPASLAGQVCRLPGSLRPPRIDIEAKRQGGAGAPALPESHHAGEVRRSRVSHSGCAPGANFAGLLGLDVYFPSHDEGAGEQLIPHMMEETEFTEVLGDEVVVQKFTPGGFGVTMRSRRQWRKAS